MAHYSISVDIAALPARVWAVMCDAERWPEWTTTVTSIRRRDGGPLAVGSRVWIRQPNLPPAAWTVTELENGRGFTWVSGGPGMRVTARHWIDPVASGSRATLSIHYSGLLAPLLAPLLAWLTRNINDRYLAIEAAGLKARSEALPG